MWTTRLGRNQHRKIVRRKSNCTAEETPTLLENLEPRLFFSAVVGLPVIGSGGGVPVAATNIYVAAGPDGNIWFSDPNNNSIGRMTPGGQTQEFSLPTADAQPQQIISGPDGALWFIESGADQIGRVSTSGQVSEFAMPSSDDSPQTLTAGPNGNVWFIDSSSNQIGQIAPGGQITEYPVSSDGSVWISSGITSGKDGSLWFTAYDDNGNGLLDRMNTQGVVTSVPLASSPLDLTTGPDGNLWVDATGEIDRVTPQGLVTAFPMPSGDSPFDITPGPDGALWFGVNGAANNFGRITPSGAISEFSLPGTQANDFLDNIVSGPGNSLWYATYSGSAPQSLDLSNALLAGGESVTVTAGSSTSQTIATFSDLGPAAGVASYQASIDWGDGTTSAGTIALTASGQYSVTGSHAWNIGFFSPTVTVTNGARTAIAYSSVEADAPTPTGVGIAVNATSGQTFKGVVANFSNVVLSSLSSYSATINWGDGHVTSGVLIPDGVGGVNVSGSTVYAASGTYTVTTQLYDFPNPPIYFNPGPWEPVGPVIPIDNGGSGATTGVAGTTSATSTTPTVYSAGSSGSSSSGTSSTTSHVPSRYLPPKHSPTASGKTSAGAPATPRAIEASAAATATSGGSVAGGGGSAIRGGVIDILPIWGQIPGIATATSTATVAPGEMSGSGYTVLPTINQTFNDVIASFTLSQPSSDLSHLHATVQWQDSGIPQFGEASSSSTPQPATIAANGSGGFTISASNTFTSPGVYHFIVRINDDRLGNGDGAIVGAAYGEAFVAWPPGYAYPLASTPPVAWSGSVVSGAAAPAGSSASGSHSGSGSTATGGSSSATPVAYPALEEHVSSKTVRIHAKAGRRFSGKIATVSGLVLPPKGKLSGFSGTINWGDGSAPTAVSFANAGKGKLSVRGTHTFLAGGPATISLNLTQALTPSTGSGSAPPIRLPTISESVQILPPGKSGNRV